MVTGRYEGDHPRRRLRHPALPRHARREQAAHARVRQADDLLPALHADAGGYPRGRRHYHPARAGRLPAHGRRRRAFGIQVCSAPPDRRGCPGFLIGASSWAASRWLPWATTLLRHNLVEYLRRAATGRGHRSPTGCATRALRVVDSTPRRPSASRRAGEPRPLRGTAYFYDNRVLTSPPRSSLARASWRHRS